MDCLDLSISGKRILAQLSPDSTLLETAERNGKMRVLGTIDLF